MAFNSITRLRLRSLLTLPRFLADAQASANQAARSPGFIAGAMLPEGRLVFWTRTGWDSETAMKAYRDSDAHRAVMPKLIDWCDEAAVLHWDGDVASDWTEIYVRMSAQGRLSRVRKPTKAHQQRLFAPMRRWAPEQPIKKQTG
ncbi:MAG: antibiotic biosynthesis monooxygenase family protein [Caulobacteraceae bacterium]